MAEQIFKVVVCEYSPFLPGFIRTVEQTVSSVKVIGIPRENPEEVPSEAKDATVLVTDPSVLGKLSSELPNLNWAHSTWAGVESVFFPAPQFEKIPKFALTKSSGFFGPLMAEWVIGQIVCWERQLLNCHEWQKEKIWGKMQIGFYRPLSSLSIGILGVGDIGKEVARVCKAFDMTVWGMVRKESSMGQCKFVDHYRTFDGLTEILTSCDYICAILPKTPETTGILENNLLKLCSEKKPVVINAGRPNIISEDSIIHAIDSGWISGAILDVFEKEPLPPNSKLWTHPKIVISPHTSASSLPKETAEAFIKNLRLYMSGQPLQFKVDWNSQY